MPVNGKAKDSDIMFYNLEISEYDLENKEVDVLVARIFRCGDNVQCVRMHLLREFKAFSGLTPGQFRSACSPYSDLFTNPV